MAEENENFAALEAYALAREAAYADLMRPPDPPTLWRDVLKIIERQIPDISFTVWFRWTRLEHISDDRIVISTEGSQAADWLRVRYLDLIQDSLAKAGRPGATVEIIVRPSPWQKT